MKTPIRIHLSPEEKAARLEAKGLDENRLPFTLSDAERAAAQPITAEEIRAMNETPAPVAVKPEADVSPNGVPLLPPKFVPHAVLVVGAAGLIIAAPELGIPFVLPALVIGIAKVIVALGLLLGITSPGLRKK